MKAQDRLLPHLNKLFLQRQNYNSHKRKIIEIRTKKIKPPIINQLSRKTSVGCSLQQSRIDRISLKVKHKTELCEPIEQCPKIANNSYSWMSPHRKQQQMEMLQQNRRMKKRLSCSKSNIGRQIFSTEYQKIQEIRRRIIKYDTNPESHKVMLKCERSLKHLPATSSYSRLRHQSHQKVDNFQKVIQTRRRSSNYTQLGRRSLNLNEALESGRIHNGEKLLPIKSTVKFGERRIKAGSKLVTEPSPRKISNLGSLKKTKQRMQIQEQMFRRNNWVAVDKSKNIRSKNEYRNEKSVDKDEEVEQQILCED